MLTQLLMSSNPAFAGAAAVTARGKEIYGDYADGRSAEGTGKLLFDIALLFGTRGAGAEAEGEVGASKAVLCSFTPSTPVLMADGKTKPIGDIKTGDKVEAANPSNGKHKGPRTVTATHVNHDYDLVDLKIQLADGKTETLHTTSKHPFWDDTLHTWVPAGQLLAGHALNTAADRHVIVTVVTPRPGDRDMYNLTVEELHTYYVLAGTTPILVHNCGPDGPAFGESCTCAPSQEFSRLGTSRESTGRLATSAQKALDNTKSFGYGVSVTPGAQEGASVVTRQQVEDSGFGLIFTPTRRDPMHHTLIFPSQVDTALQKAYNSMLGR
jgi:hypothetical protein